MRNFCCFIVATAALGAFVPPDASAQVLEGPARPFRQLFRGGTPADPNRIRNELSLTANVLGGWEDGFVPGGVGIGARAGLNTYTGFAETRLAYFRGHSTRSVAIDGRAFTTSYSASLPSTFGGDGQLQIDQPLGRSDRFQLRQAVFYDPLLTIGGFDPLDARVEPSALPASDPTAGLLAQASLRLDSAVSLTHTWNRRQSTMGGYYYNQQKPLDDLGFESRNQQVAFSHHVALSRRTSLQSGYHYSSVTDIEARGAGPATEQAANVGFTYERAVSRTRQVTFSGAVGAAHVSTVQEDTNEPVDYWTPSGNGNVSIDFGRTWSVRGGYASGLTMLNSVTRQMFFTHAVEFQLGGQFGRRLETAMSAGFTRGQTGSGASLDTGRYQNYLGTVQLTLALTRWCATVMNYGYYHYQFEDVTLTLGVPPSFNRSAVRVGLSIWLPLYSAANPGEGRRGGR